MRRTARPGTIVFMGDPAAAGVERWSSTAFHEEATAWVHDVCARLGGAPSGVVEQPHNRPWSSAIRFDATSGPLWFKVSGPGTRHEPALVDVLSRLVPGLVAEVLATDTERGWSLTRDAGPVLRQTAEPGQLWSVWEEILPRYAEAQILLAAHVGELLATGTPEVSPRTLPDQAESLLKELSAVGVEEGGLTAQEAEAVAARLPAYTSWCTELAGSGIPDSLQHDDLHSSNICWGGTVEASRVIDWGDASVGNPLGTMLCTLNSIGFHATVELEDPRVLRVRDAYLEPFTRYAARSDLVRHVALSRRVGCVGRALSYKAALLGEPVASHQELEFPVRAWFLELLEG